MVQDRWLARGLMNRQIDGKAVLHVTQDPLATTGLALLCTKCNRVDGRETSRGKGQFDTDRALGTSVDRLARRHQHLNAIARRRNGR